MCGVQSFHLWILAVISFASHDKAAGKDCWAEMLLGYWVGQGFAGLLDCWVWGCAAWQGAGSDFSI